MNAEDIRIKIGLDAESLESGLNKAMTSANHFVKGIREKMNEWGGVFSVAGMVSQIEKAMSMAMAIKKNAAITGTSVEDIQRLNLAAHEVGVSTEEANAAFEKLSVKIGDARSAGEGVETVFSKWGIAIEGKNNREIISEIAERMKEMTDPAERSAMAVALMGRNGKDLVPLLQQGAEAIKEMGSHGSIFSAQDIEDLKQAHLTIEAATNTLTVWVGKAMASTAQFFRDLGALSRGDLGYNQSDADLKQLAEGKALIEKLKNNSTWKPDERSAGTTADHPATKDEIELDKLITKRLEKMQSIEARLRDQTTIIKEANALIAVGNLTHDQEISKRLEIELAEEKILEIKKEQAKEAEQALKDQEALTKAANEMADLERQKAAHNNRYSSIEEIAGRNFVKNLNKRYGPGGRNDLGTGNGRGGQAARDFLEAEKRQLYDRQFARDHYEKGGETVDSSVLGAKFVSRESVLQGDKNRMDEARKGLEAAGVQAGDPQLAAIDEKMQTLTETLDKLNTLATGDGLKTRVQAD